MKVDIEDLVDSVTQGVRRGLRQSLRELVANPPVDPAVPRMVRVEVVIEDDKRGVGFMLNAKGLVGINIQLEQKIIPREQ